MVRNTVLTIALMLVAASPALAEEGKYQLGTKWGWLVVLDTKTGKLWRADKWRMRRNSAGRMVVDDNKYIMVPIPYEPKPFGKLQPTPPPN